MWQYTKEEISTSTKLGWSVYIFCQTKIQVDCESDYWSLAPKLKPHKICNKAGTMSTRCLSSLPTPRTSCPHPSRLLVVPSKLVAKIQRGEYVDMAVLPCIVFAEIYSDLGCALFQSTSILAYKQFSIIKYVYNYYCTCSNGPYRFISNHNFRPVLDLTWGTTDVLT